MFKRNIHYKGTMKLNSWKKLAMGTWSPPGDPSVYTLLEIDARGILKKIEEFKAAGKSLTPTTILAKALAMSIESYPLINSTIRFGRIYERSTIDLFLQVSDPNAKDVEDLSGLKIERANERSLEEMGEIIKNSAKKIRAGNDPQYKKIKKSMKGVPGIFMRPLILFLDFFLIKLNLWSPKLGVARDSFGCAMITSIGGLGFEHALVPLVPYSGCTMLMALGKIREKAVVVNGKIEIIPMMPIGATIDHRYADGYTGKKMLKPLVDYLENPV